MTEFEKLIISKEGFKTFLNQRDHGGTKHAYLIVFEDKENLLTVMKLFAKAVLCQNALPCGNCRVCKLIDQDAFSDVIVYGKDSSIKTDDINDLIDQSFIKPLESKVKIFLIANAQDMSATTQNKLLKTLEEPSNNVMIILGATGTGAILPTVLSRVERFNFSSFSNQEIYQVLKDECDDKEKLLSSITCSNGSVGKAREIYFDQKYSEINNLVCDIIVNMQSSKDVLAYSERIANTKVELDKIFSVFEHYFNYLLKYYSNATLDDCVKLGVEEAKGFNLGAVIYCCESVAEAQKRLSQNANAVMTTEWLLFKILEGKFKWRK